MVASVWRRSLNCKALKRIIQQWNSSKVLKLNLFAVATPAKSVLFDTVKIITWLVTGIWRTGEQPETFLAADLSKDNLTVPAEVIHWPREI
jgi:hypothetical protein